MEKLTMPEIHRRVAGDLWHTVYDMSRYADMQPSAGRYYSDNTSIAVVGTPTALPATAKDAIDLGSGLNPYGYANTALMMALTYALDGDRDAAREALDILWTRVDAGYSWTAAFDVIMSRPDTEVPDPEVIYAWIVDIDHSAIQAREDGDTAPVDNTGRCGPEGYSRALWERLATGEGRRWRTSCEDGLVHEGRIVYALPEGHMPHDIDFMPLADWSRTANGATDIETLNEETDKWETV